MLLTNQSTVHYPGTEEIPPARYFLDTLTQPEYLTVIRCILATIALVFIISCIVIRKRKQAEQKDA